MRSKPSRPSPKVSLVITALDRPQLLSRLLRSVARQTLLPSQVVVVDDHSNDAPAIRSALRPFRGKLPGLELIRMPERSGVCHSRNRGILASRHPLVALCDDDDEWDPPKLRKQVDLFRKNWEGIDMVYTWHRKIFHPQGRVLIREPLHRGVVLKQILRSNFISPSTVVAKRETFIQTGLFDQAMHGVEDWEMWIRFFKSGFSCEVVPEVLVTYHLHAGSYSHLVRFEHLKCLAKHFPTFLRENPGAILRLLKRTFGMAVRIALRSLSSNVKRA